MRFTKKEIKTAQKTAALCSWMLIFSVGIRYLDYIKHGEPISKWFWALIIGMVVFDIFLLWALFGEKSDER